MHPSNWATVNACLNFLSAVFLTLGFVFIKRKQIAAHKKCMTSALVSSSLFLISYLAYHALHGSTRYQGQGLMRTVYFTILITHTVLAAAIAPLVIMTVLRAWKGRFEDHMKIARITWPLWMYVSVTGVVIYFMLYRF